MDEWKQTVITVYFKGYLEPPPPSRALTFHFIHLVREVFSLLLAQTVSHCMQNFHVLLLEVLESRVQLLVPRVQYEDLETQCRAGHHEVRQGYSSRNLHCGSRCSKVFKQSCRRVVLPTQAGLDVGWKRAVAVGGCGPRRGQGRKRNVRRSVRRQRKISLWLEV